MGRPVEGWRKNKDTLYLNPYVDADLKDEIMRNDEDWGRIKPIELKIVCVQY